VSGRAPRRSAAPGCPRRPGHGPAGSSFWEVAGGEVGGRAAQGLVLHLQPAFVTAQLHELVLFGAGLPIDDAVVDVSLTDPTPHRLHGDVEVSSDLGLAQVTRRATRTTSRLKSGGNLFGTATSSLRDLVTQKRCQPNLQQSLRGRTATARCAGASARPARTPSASTDGPPRCGHIGWSCDADGRAAPARCRRALELQSASRIRPARNEGVHAWSCAGRARRPSQP